MTFFTEKLLFLTDRPWQFSKSYMKHEYFFLRLRIHLTCQKTTVQDGRSSVADLCVWQLCSKIEPNGARIHMYASSVTVNKCSTCSFPPKVSPFHQGTWIIKQWERNNWNPKQHAKYLFTSMSLCWFLHILLSKFYRTFWSGAPFDIFSFRRQNLFNIPETKTKWTHKLFMNLKTCN